MTITVEGPGGITVDFPAGTDAATIDGVMRQAVAEAANAGGPAVDEVAKYADVVLGKDKAKAREAVMRERGRQAGREAGSAQTIGANLQKGTLRNFSDEAAGLAEASNLPIGTPPVISAPIGAARLLLDQLGLTDGGARQRYDDTEARARGFYEGSMEANPILAIGSQVVGSLPTLARSVPGLAADAALYGVGEGESVAGRAALGAASGVIGGTIAKGIEKLMPAAKGAAGKAPGVDAEVVAAAERLGLPLPAGIASNSRSVQAITQAARQLPVGGGVLERSIDDFFGGARQVAEDTARKAAGREAGAAIPQATEVGTSIKGALADRVAQNEAVAARAASEAETAAQSAIAGDEAAYSAARQGLEALAPSDAAATRAVVADDLTNALRTRVADNRLAQERPYNQLRGLIDADRPATITPHVSKTLNDVMRQRVAAGETSIPRDLMPMMELATNPNGATFSGLQRARSTLAERIEFEEAQGFGVGDLKRAYGALTEAMTSAVRQSARGSETAAHRAFDAAEQNFARLAEVNKDLNLALRSGGEALADRMIGYASSRAGGNVEKLKALSRELPPETLDKVSRLAFDRLGRAPDGSFSESMLTKNWANISPEGRGILFPKAAGEIETAVGNVATSATKLAETQRNAPMMAAQTAKEAQAAAKAANTKFARMLAIPEEKVVDTMIAWGTSGARADMSSLVKMSREIGNKGMGDLAATAITKMGLGRDNQFSMAAFRKNYDAMPNGAKRLFFPDPAIRQSLDDLAVLSRRMAEVEQRFMNKSNTGRSVGLHAVTGGAVGTGLLLEPISAIASIVGTYGMARALAMPVTSKAVANWSRTYANVAEKSAQGVRVSLASLQSLSRQLSETLANELGVNVQPAALVRLAGGQQPANAESQREKVPAAR